MITWTKLQGYFIYFYAGLYGLGAVIGFFSSLTNDIGAGFLVLVVFAPIIYLLHLYAQAHFRIARRADNYIKFCKAMNLEDNEKEHSEKFFRQFKLVTKSGN